MRQPTSRAGGHRLLRLYPGAWQRRYGRELELLLDERPPTMHDQVDLLRGAVDAQDCAPAGTPALAGDGGSGSPA